MTIDEDKLKKQASEGLNKANAMRGRFDSILQFAKEWKAKHSPKSTDNSKEQAKNANTTT